MTSGMRIAMLVRALDVGGTERQVIALACGLAQRGHAVRIVQFYGSGNLAAGLRGALDAAGVELRDIGKSGRWQIMGPALRAIRLLREHRAEIVHAFLPPQNALAVALRPFLPGVKVVLGVRAAVGAEPWESAVLRAAAVVEGKLARFAHLAIANSEPGRTAALERGFPADRTIVVPNAIDTARFVPIPAARSTMRALWGVPAEALLVGIVARIDPVKDHNLFLDAAAAAAARWPELRFAVIGGGPGTLVAALRARAQTLGIADLIAWTGERRDMPQVFAALDLLALTSRNEGFPNVLAEAMACGIPCVTSEVGDAPGIVADSRFVCRSRAPSDVADAWLAALSRAAAEGPGLAARLRDTIVQRFAADTIVARTEARLAALTACPDSAGRSRLFPGNGHERAPAP
ncbi:MAG: glycosyltransferase [Alphaproteobacteria bacterium]|nr:glycosyltransferase [Alphaproteobacteria bacterium]